MAGHHTKLRGEDGARLRNEIMGAFSRDELLRFTVDHLDVELSQFSKMGNMAEIAFDLVYWAERHGRLPTLIRSLRLSRPDKLPLVEVCDRISGYATDLNFDEAPELDRRILGGDTKLLAKISDRLREDGHRYAAVFERALQSSVSATDCARRASTIADQSRSLKRGRPKRSSDRRGANVKVWAVESGRGFRLGTVEWDSGDLYAGQLGEKLGSGLGCYRIYRYGREHSPTKCATYSGQVEDGEFDGLGVYEWPNSAVLAGRWIGDVPIEGYRTFMLNEFEFTDYFGVLSADPVGNKPLERRWEPTGYGVGVNLKARTLICANWKHRHPGERDVIQF